LYVVQSILGRSVVKAELSPTLVALHLGTAMLLLAALLVSVVAARYQPGAAHVADSMTWLAYITAALAFVIILTGALVRGSGATLACVDWPLCNGAVLPVNQGQAALIHMLHRFAVLGLGVSIALLVWQVIQSGRSQLLRRVAFLALVAYLAQAAVGALFVLTTAGTVWGATHVGLAAITWALLVILSVMEYLGNHASMDRAGLQWKPQSETEVS
jgi:cytochrome c oxidase assembly protein subunit 15